MNYRNRALLDLAHRMPCMACGRDNGTTEPAHANWLEFGKGKGIKAHDCFFAALCHECHAELDQGSSMTKEQKKAFWLSAYCKTNKYLWTHDLIEVAKK
jgi:hypothetical protein